MLVPDQGCVSPSCMPATGTPPLVGSPWLSCLLESRALAAPLASVEALRQLTLWLSGTPAEGCVNLREPGLCLGLVLTGGPRSVPVVPSALPLLMGLLLLPATVPTLGLRLLLVFVHEIFDLTVAGVKHSQDSAASHS